MAVGSGRLVHESISEYDVLTSSPSKAVLNFVHGEHDAASSSVSPLSMSLSLSGTFSCDSSRFSCDGAPDDTGWESPSDCGADAVFGAQYGDRPASRRRSFAGAGTNLSIGRLSDGHLSLERACKSATVPRVSSRLLAPTQSSQAKSRSHAHRRAGADDGAVGREPFSTLSQPRRTKTVTAAAGTARGTAAAANSNERVHALICSPPRGKISVEKSAQNVAKGGQRGQGRRLSDASENLALKLAKHRQGLGVVGAGDPKSGAGGAAAAPQVPRGGRVGSRAGAAAPPGSRNALAADRKPLVAGSAGNVAQSRVVGGEVKPRQRLADGKGTPGGSGGRIPAHGAPDGGTGLRGHSAGGLGIGKGKNEKLVVGTVGVGNGGRGVSAEQRTKERNEGREAARHTEPSGTRACGRRVAAQGAGSSCGAKGTQERGQSKEIHSAPHTASLTAPHAQHAPSSQHPPPPHDQPPLITQLAGNQLISQTTHAPSTTFTLPPSLLPLPLTFPSPSPSSAGSADDADMPWAELIGDVRGMEQDVQYVRHAMLAAGFLSDALPPLFSPYLPINPAFFHHLEAAFLMRCCAHAPHDPALLTTSLPSLPLAIPASYHEERRQRMLLFDAVNEALGRRLAPFLPRAPWSPAPVQVAPRRRPLGMELVQEVWSEIHSWPVASTDEVYTVLDESARRDLWRGTERWRAQDVAEEEPGVVFDVEGMLLEELLEEVCLEFVEVEQRRASKRMSVHGVVKAHIASSGFVCATHVKGSGRDGVVALLGPACPAAVEFNGHTKRTRTVERDLNPVWDEKFVFSVPLPSPLNPALADHQEPVHVTIYTPSSATAPLVAAGSISASLRRPAVGFGSGGAAADAERSVFLGKVQDVPASSIDPDCLDEFDQCEADRWHLPPSASTSSFSDDENLPTALSHQLSRHSSRNAASHSSTPPTSLPTPTAPSAPPALPTLPTLPTFPSLYSSSPLYTIVSSDESSLAPVSPSSTALSPLPPPAFAPRKALPPATFAMVTVGKVTARTRTVPDDVNPKWNQVFAIGQSPTTFSLANPSSELQIVLKNENRLMRDSFLGAISLPIASLPHRVPPALPVDPCWIRLDKKAASAPASAARSTVKGELQLAAWIGVRADEQFAEAWQSDVKGVAHHRSRTYPSPRLWYLRVHPCKMEHLPVARVAPNLVSSAASQKPLLWKAPGIPLLASVTCALFVLTSHVVVTSWSVSNVRPIPFSRNPSHQSGGAATRARRHAGGLRQRLGQRLQNRQVSVSNAMGNVSNAMGRMRSIGGSLRSIGESMRMAPVFPLRGAAADGSKAGTGPGTGQGTEHGAVQGTGERIGAVGSAGGEEGPGEGVWVWGEEDEQVLVVSEPLNGYLHVQIVNVISPSWEEVVASANVLISSIPTRITLDPLKPISIALQTTASAAAAAITIANRNPSADSLESPSKPSPAPTLASSHSTSFLSLSSTPSSSSLASTPLLSLLLALEGGHHVFTQHPRFLSSPLPAARSLYPPPIARLEIGIISAKNLQRPVPSSLGSVGMDVYVVVRYGGMWARTRTVCGEVNPVWREQFNWPVYDLCTVVTIGVFENKHNRGMTTSTDTPLGCIRMRLSAIDSTRALSSHQPLLCLTKKGVKQLGHLHLALRLSPSISLSRLASTYIRPTLPPAHYHFPIPESQEPVLLQEAVGLLCKHLGAFDPPLRAEVVQYMGECDEDVLSVRRLKANLQRIKMLRARFSAMAAGFKAVQSWKNLPLTLAVHLAYALAVLYPSFILPTLFFLLAWQLLASSPTRPLGPPLMDLKLSQGEAREEGVEKGGEEGDDGDEEDEEQEKGGSGPVAYYKALRAKYDKLMDGAGRVQRGLGVIADSAEKIEMLLTWRDPSVHGAHAVAAAAALPPCGASSGLLGAQAPAPAPHHSHQGQMLPRSPAHPCRHHLLTTSDAPQKHVSKGGIWACVPLNCCSCCCWYVCERELVCFELSAM
ncbi:unnamed protein product [Closterium sp. Yama58-4]|nr:unnamed protein product [Closterium sp. Yama58-4]